MTKVLVVGGGGREHAIVHALSKSPKVDEIYAAPGNAGIAKLAMCVNIKDTEVEKIVQFAKAEKMDLVVVGPEASLALGIIDKLREAGIKAFGPTKAAAQIESSKEFAKNYNIRAMMESIEESIKSFYAKTPWGYKTFFYISASNECHPSYVEFFQKKECLSVTMLDELLAMIEPYDKKLLYDKDLAESLFNSYIENKLDDKSMSLKLSEMLSGRKVLIVGPGKNIYLQRDKVKKFIEDNNPIVISINYIPKEIKVDVVFATKANRYQEMAAKLLEMSIKIIGTSNISCRNGSFDFVFNRRSLLELKEEIKDNSFLMLLKILELANIRQVFCAGLDGYSDKDDNYISPGMEYEFIKHKAMHLNSHIKNVISEMRENMDISFITFSKYDIDYSIDSASF